MKIRQLKMDFSQVRPHWAPNIEFAQHENAASLMPVHVEPYLIKVMIKARALLGPEHAALIEDLNILIKQEVQHHNQHKAFNQKLYDAGYARLAEFEQELSDDYKRMLQEKSLKFNCAYCEGFETMGPPNAQAFFSEYGGLLNGADKVAVDLWKWHMAEEFEHRDVCHRVYNALYGKTFYDRYCYRVYGLLCAMKHLGSWGKRVSTYLVAKDRETMSPKELEASQLRAAEAKKMQVRHFLPHLLPAFLPFYNPANKKAPKGMDDFMARLEAEYSPAAR